MICPTCNKEIEDGVLVCEYCGQEFAYEEVEEEVVTAEAEGAEEAEAVETAETAETTETTETVEAVEEDVEEVVVEKSGKGFAIAAFVCALCGIACIFSPAGLVLSILAVVFHHVYVKRGGEATKMTKAARIIGLIVLIVSAIVTVVGAVSGSIFASTRWDDLERFCEKFVDWVGDFFKLFRVFR